MKEIIFNEDQLNNLEEIGKQLFLNNSDDPSSNYYKRHLNQPSLNYMTLSLHTLIPLLLSLTMWKSLLKMRIKPLYAQLITITGLIIYILLSLKKILIFFIHLYQHFAPDSLRLKCRFEPSCSEYMILAIQKYGVFKGIKKGINRLKRCKVENGGYDFP